MYVKNPLPVLLLNNPIAVFDSGIGSLSIVRELRKVIPSENLLYLADKSNFPYGSKSHKDLLDIIFRTIKYLSRYRPKLVIIASNTPSIQVLDEVRKRVDLLIIGVRPPLRQACMLTKKKHIGIMATAGALKSNELESLIRKEVPQNIFITKINASAVIQLIENGTYLTNEKLTFKTLLQIVGDELDDKIDVITLSSTHLPFVKNYLVALLPKVKFLDPAKIVAQEVRKSLKFNRMLRKSGNGQLEIQVSDGKREFERILHAMDIREPIREVFLPT
jgi:glutamate racemase